MVLTTDGLVQVVEDKNYSSELTQTAHLNANLGVGWVLLTLNPILAHRGGEQVLATPQGMPSSGTAQVLVSDVH